MQWKSKKCTKKRDACAELLFWSRRCGRRRSCFNLPIKITTQRFINDTANTKGSGDGQTWNGSQLWSVMRKTCWPNSYSEFIFCYLHRMMQCFGDLSVADPGEEPETAPRYLRVWMTAPPYVKVWIRQWLITWHNAVILPFTSNFTWYIANKATHCKQNEVHSLEKPPLTISHAAAWSYPHEWGERNSTYCNI